MVQFLFYSLKIPFHCEGNAALFPFDEMSCTAKLESRKYPFHSFNLYEFPWKVEWKRVQGINQNLLFFFSGLYPRGGPIPMVVAHYTRKPVEE